MLNKVILIGRLGQDPEKRTSDADIPMAKFSIATNETYKKDGEKVEHTEWHNVVCWRELAQLAERYLHKGMLVYVEGKLVHRDYLDKEGQKRYITEVVANTFRMLERRDANGSWSESKEGGMTRKASMVPVEGTAAGGEDDGVSDLPF
ncbi:MAG: hypothetical protein RLY31_2959 [Bacteroidota bacterium]|jgi:single-strand DNA-binding protein